MLSSLYLSDTDDKDAADEDDELGSCLFNVNVIQTMQAYIDKLFYWPLAQKYRWGNMILNNQLKAP